MKKLLFTLLFCAAAAAAAGSEPAELKLLSYNIRYIGAPGDEGDFAWDARKEASIRMIRDVRPDVIGFQEPRRQQVAYLVEQLPEYGHIEMGRDFGAKDDPGEHLMIMYLRERYELLDHGHYWLSETPDEVSQGWDGRCRRVTVWARLRDRATGREFCLFDTHLDHIGKTARLEGARLNVERMRSIAGKRTPQFIVGDMNATAGTPGGVCLEPYFKWLKSACEEAPLTDPRPTYHGFGKADASAELIYGPNIRPWPK
ncbi:MAG: endonuclease, partial [Alistipes finegoldii]|nr:endonuclease [Alistipes finegoldii]